MADIFKAYDIRGIYGEQLNEDLAYRIGRAYADFLGARNVAVGRDMRPHSMPLFEALASGLTEQGAEVVDLGLCSTPMLYYGVGSLEADGGIMITASHNPGEYNGFKLCRDRAIPISGATGIKTIEQKVEANAFSRPERKGAVSARDISAAYAAHARAFASPVRPLEVAADFANAMGILEARAFPETLKLSPLFDRLDGTFPNHEANPLKTETFDAIRAHMAGGGYAFGIAFDGDADRVGFLDERGEIVPMDIITALIAQTILREHAGATIFYDLRSSRAVREVIEENGGKPMMSRVGHAFIKQQMRDADAVFAGELSGHYYFKENYYTESSAMAVLCVAELLSRSDRSLSELVRPIMRYSASGEINSRVEDVRAVFERLRAAYPEAEVTGLDGLTFTFDDWWFNVRPSNTEPLVRLNVEARDRTAMKRHRDDVLARIRA